MTLVKKDIKEHLEKLKLFNEKAQKIERSDFLKQIRTNGISITISVKKDKPGMIKRKLPTEGAVDAFMNNYRFFCQNNEGSSFENIHKVYNSLPILKEKKNKFVKARRDLNQYLDSHLIFDVIINNRHLTKRELLDTFMYGMIVHANKNYRELIKRWEQDPILFSILLQEFTAILLDLVKYILFVMNLNNKIIEEFEMKLHSINDHNSFKNNSL